MLDFSNWYFSIIVHLATVLWGSKNQIISNYNIRDNMCMSHLITSENKLIMDEWGTECR